MCIITIFKNWLMEQIKSYVNVVILQSWSSLTMNLCCCTVVQCTVEQADLQPAAAGGERQWVNNCAYTFHQPAYDHFSKGFCPAALSFSMIFTGIMKPRVRQSWWCLILIFGALRNCHYAALIVLERRKIRCQNQLF